MTVPPVISADSHIQEPPELYSEWLDAKYRHRAPRREERDGKTYVIVDGKKPRRIDLADQRATEEDQDREFRSDPTGGRDVERRLSDMTKDGIVGEVMYPSLSMFTFAVPDNEIKDAAFRQHNDWILDYCAPNPERLIGVGCLPIPDVAASVAEAKRAGELGVKGFAIPAHAGLDLPYSDPAYDPLWAVLQEMDLPITMHIFTGVTLDGTVPGAIGAQLDLVQTSWRLFFAALRDGATPDAYTCSYAKIEPPVWF